MRRLISSASLAAIAVSLILLKAEAQSAPIPAQPIPESQGASGGKMEFEVASIRPAVPGTRSHSNLDLSPDDTTVPSGGRFSAVGAIGMFIQFAYRLSVFQDQDAFKQMPKWATQVIPAVRNQTGYKSLYDESDRDLLEEQRSERSAWASK